ncbi:hypothetical protein [Nocardia sp. NPDC004604]|uniref:hypothetical protein n=1 Tax=Nocardia sp. NPDC004604 TaxID=3157013 RepID=UPI0033B64B87
MSHPDLAALHALMIDRHIVWARRRDRIRRDWTIAPGRPVPWARIGEAFGLTGQVAVSSRPRAWP